MRHHTFAPRRALAALLLGSALVAGGVGLAPSLALAEGEIGGAPTTQAENEYEVGSADELAKAIDTIEQSGASEATLVLTGSINDDAEFAGIEDVHVTVKSSGDAAHSLDMKPTTSLVGDLTLDNVNVTARTIYACGHVFETTGNFTDSLDFLAGGGPEGVNVSGDTRLVLRGGSFTYVYGGGHDSSVTGSVSVLLDGATADNFYGGGMAEKTASGTVGKNVTLELRSGIIKELFGGGDNRYASTSREPARVYGDVSIVCGYEGAEPFTMMVGTAMSAHGGSNCSTVGNISFSLLEGTSTCLENQVRSTHSVFGAGWCDDVTGTISVTVKDAYVGALYGLGNNIGSPSCVLDGRYSRVLNADEEKNAINLVWDVSPEIDAEAYDESHRIHAFNKTESLSSGGQVEGDVLIEMRSGKLARIGVEDSGSSFTQFPGNSKIIVSGGDVCIVRGNPDAYSEDDRVSEIVFSGATDSKVGYLWNFDRAMLESSSNVSIDTDHFPGLLSDPQNPFYSVDDLSITEGSTLVTCPRQTTVKGTLAVSGDSSWHAKGKTWIYGTASVENSSIYFDRYSCFGYDFRGENDPTDHQTVIMNGAKIVSGANTNGTSWIYGNVSAKDSTWSLMHPQNVRGRVDMDGLTLLLPLMTVGVNNYPDEKIPLNIEGVAGGSATVFVTKNEEAELGGAEASDATAWQAELVCPAVFDNYITAWAPNGTGDGEGQDVPVQATFVLGNEDARAKGYYLKRVLDPEDESGYYMWQVADGYGVTFDKNNDDEGSTEAAPRIVVLPLEPTEVGHVSPLPTEPTRPGYEFAGWNTQKDGSGDAFTSSYDVKDDMVVYAQWKALPAQTIAIQPQDMVAYTGGESLGGDSFPATRYEVTLSEGLDAGDVTFTVDGTTYQLPGDTETGAVVALPWLPDVFTLRDGSEMGGADTNEGQVATSDLVAGEYAVAVDDTKVSASAGGKDVDLEFGSSTLTVRDVSDPEGVLDENDPVDVAQPVVSDKADVDTSDGVGVAVIDGGTQFYTNGRAELGLLGDGENDAQVSLLFDELLPGEGGEDTAAALRARAATDGHELTAENSEFRYLDLVNENDGNAWVSTEDGAQITVYWPIPKGVDPDEVEFSVLHFKGLHREYRGDLEQQVAACEVEVIDARVEGGNVVFTLTGDQDAGCFSPFALAWAPADEPGGGDTPAPPVTGGDDDDDEPDVPDTPEDPDDPDTPDTPENPDEPDTPDEPEGPDTPDTPDTPEDPEDPDEPDEPDTPDTPDDPGEPEPAPEPEPSAPEVPDTGEPASLVLLAGSMGAATVGMALALRRRS